jgi:hypothetical protein
MTIGALLRDSRSFEQLKEADGASGRARNPDTLRTNEDGGLTNCGAHAHLDGRRNREGGGQHHAADAWRAGLPPIRILVK